MADSNEFDPTIDASQIPLGETPAHAVIGRKIGPYRILGKLGEGGMGLVFEAEQAAPKRRVALKVIRGGELVGEVHLQLFRREVETLARLKHPNIASIYDAGVTETGEHYFAMELVPGATLDKYIAERPAPDNQNEIRFRLRFFRTLCDGVAYAHQRGVIHRDLKPSNILVAMPDETGSSVSVAFPVPKILDFGLARIAESELGDNMKTEVGAIRGTLAYMSPEQARGNPDEIDLRTDVYSLGMILYEMLIGVRPYDVGKSSLYDAIKIICDAPITPPSLKGKSKHLDQDLTTILLHALEKEADRRYPSAGALSEDIGLYLESRPITARAPSRIYQFRKFAQRNRGLVTGVSAAVVALAAGIVATTTFGLREAAQRRAADDARRGVQTVVEFQQQMLTGIDAARMGDALSGDLKARFETSLRDAGAGDKEIAEARTIFDRDLSGINMTDAALKVIDANILKRALSEASTRFADKPAIRASLLQSIGETYSALGLVPEADTTLTAARDLYRQLYGRDSEKALTVDEALGTMYLEGGEFDKAEPLNLSVIESRKRTLGPDDPATLRAEGTLALMYSDQGNAAKAESLFTISMKGLIAKTGEENRETLNVMNNYAWFLYEQRRFAEAESLCTRTLALRRKVQGNDNNETMDTVNNLAVIYRSTNRLDKAEPLFREGYEWSRKFLGEEHPSTLPAMSNLGRLLMAQGKNDEAEVILHKAAVTARKILPPQFFGRGVILQSWAEALIATKHYREAVDPLTEAYGIISGLDPESPGIPHAVESFITIYEQTGDSKKAAEWKAKVPAAGAITGAR